MKPLKTSHCWMVFAIGILALLGGEMVKFLCLLAALILVAELGGGRRALKIIGVAFALTAVVIATVVLVAGVWK